MIDVYAPVGAFRDRARLVRDLATAVITIERVPAGGLDREKQLAVVAELTRIVAAAAVDPAVQERIWVLLTEAPDGGWGLAAHAHTNAELVAAARAQLGKK